MTVRAESARQPSVVLEVQPAWPALTMPYTASTGAATTASVPPTSRPRWSPLPRALGSSGTAMISASRPIGTLTRKIQCQFRLWVSRPPAITPTVPPPEPTKPQMLMALARSAGGSNRTSTIDSDTALTIEPPMP